MSSSDRENIRDLKRQEPSVIGIGLGATVAAGILGTMVADVVDFSTPNVAVWLSDVFGDGSVALKSEVVTAGVKDMLANEGVMRLGQHGMELVSADAPMPWGVQTLEVSPSNEAFHLLANAGKKIVYDPELMKGLADVDTVTRAVQLRDAIDTLHNHDGEAIGKFVVGNMVGQAAGGAVGFVHGLNEHDKWSRRIQEERAKLNPVDRFLV
jgi:hypothetical protein